MPTKDRRSGDGENMEFRSKSFILPRTGERISISVALVWALVRWNIKEGGMTEFDSGQQEFNSSECFSNFLILEYGNGLVGFWFWKNFNFVIWDMNF